VEAFRAASSSARLTDENKEEDDVSQANQRPYPSESRKFDGDTFSHFDTVHTYETGRIVIAYTVLVCSASSGKNEKKSNE